MNPGTWGAWIEGWLGFGIEVSLYALGIAFVLFLLFLAWMVLEDIVEKDED